MKPQRFHAASKPGIVLVNPCLKVGTTMPPVEPGYAAYCAAQWGGDAVGLAGASPCDDNGCVRADKLRKALGLVKVNFLVGHWVLY